MSPLRLTLVADGFAKYSGPGCAGGKKPEGVVGEAALLTGVRVDHHCPDDDNAKPSDATLSLETGGEEMSQPAEVRT
jgi:hypothetical protein